MSRRASRRPVTALSLGGLVVLTLCSTALGTGVAVGSPAAAVLAPAAPSTLTAAAVTLAGLSYDGVVSVPTTAGDVQAIALTSTSAELTALRLQSPCLAVGGLSVSTEVSSPAGSTTTVPGGLTLYATSVTGTSAGTTVTWSPANPPPAAQLGDVSLTDATVGLVSLSAPTLAVPGLQQTTSFCGP